MKQEMRITHFYETEHESVLQDNKRQLFVVQWHRLVSKASEPNGLLGEDTEGVKLCSVHLPVLL